MNVVRLPIHSDLDEAQRPRVRADCLEGGQNEARPCRWKDCYYYLKHEKASCVLDIADEGGITLEEVSEVMGVTRERIRQIETLALKKLARKGIIWTLHQDIQEDPERA